MTPNGSSPAAATSTTLSATIVSRRLKPDSDCAWGEIVVLIPSYRAVQTALPFGEDQNRMSGVDVTVVANTPIVLLM